MKLNRPETAPKDTDRTFTVILADFGNGYLQPAVWNAAGMTWSAAEVKVVNRMVWDERYFKPKTIDHSEMRGWLPIPTMTQTGEKS